jgi:GrxC family glutaredoxin
MAGLKPLATGNSSMFIKGMSKVTVYTTDYCPFCDAAKSFLKSKGIHFEEIDVSKHEDRVALKKRTGWMTVPQIFIGNHLIGGYQELVALDQMGELQKRVKAG